ncbi:hypothetical protein AWV79_00250 [Cupriavidus sp. UYMMa02A]|nr:hypothetical protein AWV79_00250 [Cupriavidus sp. UYMMa02A]
MYQVRGLDLANMTIVEGQRGIILIDTLTSTETAKAALELYYANRPRKPVVAVIYTHSHLDHFGGVRGVVDEADVKAGKVAIYAPDGSCTKPSARTYSPAPPCSAAPSTSPGQACRATNSGRSTQASARAGRRAAPPA